MVDNNPIVMYLIVRESLNMSPGKIAAQAAHGACMIFREYLHEEYQGPLTRIKTPPRSEQLISENRCKIFEQWYESGQTKIVLRADDKEWEKVKNTCDCLIVVDLGRTEVDPGSETVIALWPLLKSESPKIIKKLQVL